MTETPATFHNPEMPTIPYSVTKRPKTDVDMTDLNKNDIDEAIHQKLRNKDVWKSDMHTIYNLIVVQMNEQLQEKAASDTTFQDVKTDQDPIGYLMILKILWLSNQSYQKPIN